MCFPFMYEDPTEYDCNNRFHRPVDPELKAKLKNCRLEFMHLLIRWFERYKREGLMEDLAIKVFQVLGKSSSSV